MDLAGGADTGLERALDPRVPHRAVLASEVRAHASADAVLRLEDERLVALPGELEPETSPAIPAPITITFLRSPRRASRPAGAVRNSSGGVGGADAGLGGPSAGIGQRQWPTGCSRELTPRAP